MAVRIATSDPKPSSKPEHRGYSYFYFNKRLPSGSECAALIPDAIRDIVKKGFTFDDNSLAFNPELKASVLELDFDEPPVEDPALPPGDQGWSDPDHLTALAAADPQALNAIAQRSAVLPNRGVRPATARKQDAAARAAEHNLPMEFLQRLEYLARAQRFVSAAIGVNEKPRAVDAQKLVVTAWIDYTKSRGTELSDEEERAMRF